MTFAETRISEKIYTNLQSNHYCNRRLNSTHQMGCTSDLGGNHGVVWEVSTDQDLKHVTETGPTPPYIVILNQRYYTRDNLLSFKRDRIAGVVLMNETNRPEPPFSPEDTCQNRYSGLYVNDTKYGGCEKNTWLDESTISGLLNDDIPYPIFYINRQDSQRAIRNCIEKNYVLNGLKKTQSSYPLCGMQLDSFMIAAKDTPTCLPSDSILDELLQSSGRRCINVENYNIFAYYKTSKGNPVLVDGKFKPEIIKHNTVVLLTSRLSSVSMFTDISPAADSTISSIVTLLAVAEALAEDTIRVRNEVNQTDRNIAFAFLDSEPFDYLGSLRMSFDMQKNSFPILSFDMTESSPAIQNLAVTSLDYVIDLNQLALHEDSDKVYLHLDPSRLDHPKLDKLTKALKQAADGLKMSLMEVKDLPLPPSSVQQFILRSPEDSKLLGAVLSNYRGRFVNQYYHSIFDDLDNIKFNQQKDKLVDHLTTVSSIVATAAYELAFKEYIPIRTNKDTIENLLNCYLINAECGLFTKAWYAGSSLPRGPVMTFHDPTRNLGYINGEITTNLLAYFLGEKTPLNATECARENKKSHIYEYLYVNGKSEPVDDRKSGLCIRSQAIKSEIHSPAYEQTDGRLTINESYPTWSISHDNIRNPARIFMMPSPVYQYTVFFSGIVITLISFIVVHSMKRLMSTIDSGQDRDGTPT